MTTDDSASARLFVALWPSPALRQQLVAHQARWSWPEHSALTSPDKLHLTLHFIGDVPAARLPAIQQGLQVHAPRFTLELDAPELWPNHCAMWCPTHTPAALSELHLALAQALRALDLAVEPRRFSPHVTLARRASGAKPPDEAPPLQWPARGYALVQSAGGRYTPIERYG